MLFLLFFYLNPLSFPVVLVAMSILNVISCQWREGSDFYALVWPTQWPWLIFLSRFFVMNSFFLVIPFLDIPFLVIPFHVFNRQESDRSDMHTLCLPESNASLPCLLLKLDTRKLRRLLKRLKQNLRHPWEAFWLKWKAFKDMPESVLETFLRSVSNMDLNRSGRQKEKS